MSDFKISIVILANNATDLICKTLESLLEQTFANWEAIVIDNENSDRLQEILADFTEQDSRIRLVDKSETNVSTARNLGVELAQYGWLLFIDGGNWLLPEHLEKLTTKLTAAPQSDAVFCNWTLVTADGQQNNSLAYNIFQFSELEQGLFYHLGVCNQFPLHACIIKKSLVQEVGGFAPELATCQAWDLWQRIARMGIRWTSIDLVLASCLLKPKKPFLNSEQLLRDGLQVITRGHQTDPRVSQPHGYFVKGSPLRKMPNAQFYWTGYCAGIAIALKQDYVPLLNYLASQANFAALSIDFATIILDRGIILGIRDAVYTNSEEFESLWPRLKPKVEQFFQKFNQYSDKTFKITSRIKSIEAIILEQIVTSRPVALTQVYAVSIDATQPIVEVSIPSPLETLNCQVRWGEKSLGSINLPVFAGQVSKLVLADAIANRYVWEILGIEWTVFLQELWGLSNWNEANLSQTTVEKALTVNHQEWLIVEVSEDLNDVAVIQDTLQVVVQVGGVSIGVMTIAVENQILTAAELRTEIVNQAGPELARAAVREGLLGQPLTKNSSLRDRLLKAAKLRRNGSPLQLEADAILPNTGRILNQCFSSAKKTVIFGYRQGQPIGTSASRWAMFPPAMIEDLTKSAAINDEPMIKIFEQKSLPQQVLYSPDLIVPQISSQGSSPSLNFQGNNSCTSYTDKLPILMYHRVAPLDSSRSDRWCLSPQLFEQQLCYLQKKGFYSITLEDWRKSMVNSQPLPGNAMIITFDDGYQDFSDYAYPLLKKYGFSAMVFLIVDLIGLEYNNYHLMGWQKIKQLQREGVEFGSHSLDHASFTDISYADLIQQAAQSKAILSQELGVPINALAYPYGNSNSVVKHLVGACGYVFGLQVGLKRSSWQDSLLGLSRIEIESSDFLPRFMLKLHR